jgi:hypothetical protein
MTQAVHPDLVRQAGLGPVESESFPSEGTSTRPDRSLGQTAVLRAEVGISARCSASHSRSTVTLQGKTVSTDRRLGAPPLLALPQRT